MHQRARLSRRLTIDPDDGGVCELVWSIVR
jgi:hypothetical protein